METEIVAKVMGSGETLKPMKPLLPLLPVRLTQSMVSRLRRFWKAGSTANYPQEWYIFEYVVDGEVYAVTHNGHAVIGWKTGFFSSGLNYPRIVQATQSSNLKQYRDKPSDVQIRYETGKAGFFGIPSRSLKLIPELRDLLGFDGILGYAPKHGFDPSLLASAVYAVSPDRPACQPVLHRTDCHLFSNSRFSVAVLPLVE